MKRPEGDLNPSVQSSALFKGKFRSGLDYESEGEKEM